MATRFEKEMAQAKQDRVPDVTYNGKTYSTGIPSDRKGVRKRSPAYVQTLEEIWTPKEIDQ